MRRTLGIAMLCLAALAPSRVGADASVLIVQQGDALSTIAKRAGVSVEQIKHWNDLDGDMIRIGQKLVVGQAGTRSRSRDGIDWTPPFDYGAAAPATSTQAKARIAARDSSSAVATRLSDDAAVGKKPRRGRTYRVQKGDTLTGIALRHHTTVGALLASNPGIRADRIFPGETIDIGVPRPEVVFKLERGDSLLAVANRYDVSPRDLSRWNGGLSQREPRPGTNIRLYTRVPVSPSEAIGPTNRGRLENGVRLPSHRGYVIRSAARAYGTEETNRWIVNAFNAVDSKFKERKVVRIHDISDRDGGRLRDHKSHQNGRDADISYYQKECGPRGCRFDDFRASELDVARQWTLLEHWLRHGQAEMIFIDYRLQAKLYRYAKRRGATKAQLDRWIQYPRGKYEPNGVIRHFPNHEDHLHVRFVCPYSDLSCRP
ncbi:MAG: LysM peptidoglycan-binding domain-containing protein [Myxococcales bacterium]|nr:LysM peptidoglycan-binding domain-containing protein [Myxococcales bacterium]